MKVDFGTVIPAVQAGDKDAQDALMRGFYAWTVGHCRRTVGDPDLAADIAVAYWDWLLTKGGIQRYHGEIPAFTWLRQQLRDLMRDYLRNRHAPPIEFRADIEDAEGGDSPEALASAAELSRLVEAALDPEDAMIYRGLLEGLEVVEIARAIGRPRESTGVRISRLRAKVRGILGDDAGRR